MSSRNYTFTIHIANVQDFYDEEITNETFEWSIVPDEVFEDYVLSLGGLEPDQKEVSSLVDGYLSETPISYIVYQREVCPTTGRHHYQGYVEFNRKVTRNQWQELARAPRSHCAPRLKSQESNVSYCSKTETSIGEPFIWGELSKQGKRNDLKKMKSSVLMNINSSTNIRDFAVANPGLYIRNHAGIDKLVGHHKKSRDFKTEVYIHWGVAGSGKTFKVYDDARKQNLTVYKKPNGQWWDGYEGQDIVLIDDYDNECTLPFREFLQLNDCYPHSVPVKGSFRQFTSRKIVYTTNQSPYDWYSNLSYESSRAFIRRVTKCYYFDGNNYSFKEVGLSPDKFVSDLIMVDSPVFNNSPVSNSPVVDFDIPRLSPREDNISIDVGGVVETVVTVGSALKDCCC